MAFYLIYNLINAIFEPLITYLMKIKKGDILHNVSIGDLVAEGKCISKINDAVIFSKYTAPGDVVDLKVNRKKKSFYEASIVEIKEKSGNRVEPFCEHFGTCGGCKWQHIDYKTQIEYKEKQVFDAIERIGHQSGFEKMPIMSSEQTEFYRNKLEYTASDSRWLTYEQIKSGDEFDRRGLGFHVPGMFDKIIDINKCHLQNDESNNIRIAVKEFCKDNDIPFFNIRNKEGQLRNLIIRNTLAGELMVIVQLFFDDKKRESLMNFLENEFPEITSLLYVINNKGNETFHDLEIKTHSGKDHIVEEMEGLKFKIGPKSFYQTNSKQAEVLYSITKDFSQINADDVVYDLYTGTGTIANYVARDCKKVVGVEYVDAAIVDAKLNSEVNKIDNTVFYAGDMKDVFTDEFISNNGKPNVVITDPPRAGMHKDVVETLLRLEAPKIVYVSCNPATQARDIELFSEKYKLKKVQPVDMFPHTHHVESVALLELK